MDVWSMQVIERAIDINQRHVNKRSYYKQLKSFCEKNILDGRDSHSCPNIGLGPTVNNTWL